MRVISKRPLREFWLISGRRDAEIPLKSWYRIVNSKRMIWHHWSDVKDTFGNASIVGDCVVFNIAGKNYRLVTRIRYRLQKVFVLRVMTHAEYDDPQWKVECGC